MIHKDLNFSVNIRAGVNGPILQEYDSEGGRISRSIEAVTDTVLCTQITLHKDFEWFDADGLYVAIRYGSRDYQIELWIPKPSTPQLDDEDDWSFQIPGKNILDAATNQITGCQYRFAELETWQCGKSPGQDCVELKQGNERYLGTIWVSIKRRKVKDGLAPTSAKDNKDPKLALKACRHSSAVGTEGVKHTVKNEQVAPFEMGVMIPNPKQDQLTDLDDTGKHQGHFMNSIFVFRGKGQLSRVRPESDDARIGGSTDKNVPSKASKSTSTLNAVLGTNATKKRRRAQPDDSTVAETDPSLNAGNNTHSQRKKSKKSDKADLGVLGLSSPAAGYSKSQDEERESLLNTFTQKPNKEAKSGGKTLQAGQTKESRGSGRSDSVPKAPAPLDHSMPKLSSVLNEEYRKLNAAGNGQRRSKSKHARVSSYSSNQSDQSATSGAPMSEKTRAQPDLTSKNARLSQRTSISSDSDQSRQTGSSKASVVEKELGGPEPSNPTRRNSNLMGTDLETPLRTVEPDAKPATLEQEIKALQERKERLEERLKRKLEAERLQKHQLKLKLEAECEELERQLKE